MTLTDSPVQFPLFNESGRIRLKDDERIWGKVSQAFTGTSPTPLNAYCSSTTSVNPGIALISL